MRYERTVIHKQWAINYIIQCCVAELLKTSVNIVSGLDAKACTLYRRFGDSDLRGSFPPKMDSQGQVIVGYRDTSLGYPRSTFYTSLIALTKRASINQAGERDCRRKRQFARQSCEALFQLNCHKRKEMKRAA